MLLLTLAVTPARRLLGWAALARYRRTLGLLTFSYATLHVLTYVSLDLAFELSLILEDLTERPYIMAGATAFFSMVPLALTSTRAWIRRLGARWVTLHKLVYVAAIAAVIHFLWLVKADLMEPLIYAALAGLLLGARVVWKLRSSPPRTLRQP